MKTWAAAAALLTLPLAACSSGDSDDSDAEPAAATVTVTETASAEPSEPEESDEPEPLALTISDGTGRTCFTPDAPRDLAWFDVTWKANEDLESFSFELIDPVGVKKVGGGLVVPPVNFGGRIDFGGASSWETRAKALDNRWVSWAQRSSIWGWTPIEGQTGLLVLHLRLDDAVLDQPGGGGFDGVTATYRTDDGETDTVTADAPSAYVFRKRC